MKQQRRATLSVVLLLATGGSSWAAENMAGIVTERLTAKDQLSSKFRINDDDPESTVPSFKERNANPVEFGYYLQDMLVQAEAVRKAKDYAALLRYRRALVKAAPEGAKSWSQLCEVYDLVNDREHAIPACREAIFRPGVEVSDFYHLFKLVMQKPEALTAAEVTELQGLLTHVEAQDSGLAAETAAKRCQLATKAADVPMLEACTATLVKLAPDDLQTVTYQWSLAVRQGKKTEARAFFARAEKLGATPESLDSMAKFTSTGLLGLRGAKGWVMGATVAAGLVGLVAFWTTQRRRLAGFSA